MSEKKEQIPCEKFKTTIGGQALIEGIMMRGPEKDAVVVCTAEGLNIDVKSRKLRPKKSPWNWPFLRGVANMADSLKVGQKSLMDSAKLVETQEEESTSKFDQWLERKLSNKKTEKIAMGIIYVFAFAMMIGMFFLIPMIVASFFDNWIHDLVLLNLLEGFVRILIIIGYMWLCSLIKDMRRVFSYHGAEHKVIRCYEAGLPLTVENVRIQKRMHPRCGTSFLIVIAIVSVLVFSVASSGLLAIFPWLKGMAGTFSYRLLMIVFKLLTLPLVVAIGYEINRIVARHDNWFTRILMAPGIYLQYITTKEPDDRMIEVGIAALEAVLPEVEGSDKW